MILSNKKKKNKNKKKKMIKVIKNPKIKKNVTRSVTSNNN